MSSAKHRLHDCIVLGVARSVYRNAGEVAGAYYFWYVLDPLNRHIYSYLGQVLRSAYIVVGILISFLSIMVHLFAIYSISPPQKLYCLRCC
jgi:hypothetical protein